jgi:hypothetical protein
VVDVVVGAFVAKRVRSAPITRKRAENIVRFSILISSIRLDASRESHGIKSARRLKITMLPSLIPLSHA